MAGVYRQMQILIILSRWNDSTFKYKKIRPEE
jgi:hypothetical protein